jgi:dihydroorotase
MKNDQQYEKEIEIILPDDFHHHFRDNQYLETTVHYASQRFGRCIVMPNTVPPIRNKKDAEDYLSRIMEVYSKKKNKHTFIPLMTLYLTDNTSTQDIIDAKEGGILACKLYPFGATTNSNYGVTNINNIDQILKLMSDINMILLVHCEATDKKYDIFDREKYGIEMIMKPIIKKYPNLKIVMEHITSKESVEFVKECNNNVAATITAHHLLYNRNDILVGGIRPHMYCLPILKSESDRESLIEAATSGNPKFFLGTDSAPHSVNKKECSCGCAGIFTSHIAIELYAEAFDKVNKIHMLERFTSVFGANFYGIPINEKKIKLRKLINGILIKEKYKFGNDLLKPLRGGEYIKWIIEGVNYN